MKKNIQAALAKLSKEKEIRILYACESGSRAWGFASPDSDYDVRFLFVKPLDKYLSLSFGEDSINRMLDHDLDLAGWELRKLLNLLKKRDTSPFEWLQSPFLYHKEASFLEELRALSKQYFSPRACTHHYYGIAHNSLKTDLVGDQFKLKTYFYVLRPMLCALWICEHQSIPPLVFEQLFPLLEKQPEVKAAIEALLEQKKQASEANLIELLATPEDSVLKKHPIMEALKPELFLPKLCFKTFAGYAQTQVQKARGLNKKILNPIEKERKSILDFCHLVQYRV